MKNIKSIGETGPPVVDIGENIKKDIVKHQTVKSQNIPVEKRKDVANTDIENEVGV